MHAQGAPFQVRWNSTAARAQPATSTTPFDPSAHALWGVDVSHHQGHVDWGQVAREPRMTFAILKATQGVTRVDPLFRRNWREARRAGLVVGAYHDFSFCTPAREQAHHFLRVLPRGQPMLPATLDVEHLMNCAPDPDPARVIAELRLWLTLVERATGKRPFLYATSDVLDQYVLGQELPVHLWVRHTPEDPEPVRDLAWRLLQYDDQRTCPGIATTVDRDVFRGDSDELRRLVRGRPDVVVRQTAARTHTR